MTSSGSPNIAINVWFEVFNFQKQFDEAGYKENEHVVKVYVET